jgi:ATP-dependent Lhr-like helicase
VEALRRTRRLSAPQQPVVLCAADPLNLTGSIAPGPRIPAQSGRRIVIADGLIREAEAPERALRAAL